MAIACTKLDSGVNGTATSSFSSNSISSPTGRLLVACFVTCEGTRTHSVQDDNGNSWTQLSSGHYDTDRTISWHYLIVPGTALSGNIVICTPSGSHNQGHWCILEFTGFDTTTPFPQSPAIGTGANSPFTKTLSAAVGSGSKHVIAVCNNIFQALTPDANTTELCDHSGNSAGTPLGNSFAVGWSNADFETTLGFTGTNGNWGALSFEIAEPSSGTNVDVPSALLTDDVFPSATVTATGGVTPTGVFTDDVFPSASLSATAAVTAGPVFTDDIFPSATVTATAAVTPSPVFTDDVFPSATVTATGNVTAGPVLTTDLFPTPVVTTGVFVTPDPVLTTDLFPAVSIATSSSPNGVLTTDLFPAASVTATAGVTPSPVFTDDVFPSAVVTANAGVTPAAVFTDDIFPSSSISATGSVTAGPVLTTDLFPTPSVSNPSNPNPNPVLTTDLFPAATLTHTGNATPNPVVTLDLFPSSSVDDGTGTAVSGSRGIVWINEPWFDWPTDEEALV